MWAEICISTMIIVAIIVLGLFMAICAWDENAGGTLAFALIIIVLICAMLKYLQVL